MLLSTTPAGHGDDAGRDHRIRQLVFALRAERGPCRRDAAGGVLVSAPPAVTPLFHGLVWFVCTLGQSPGFGGIRGRPRLRTPKKTARSNRSGEQRAEVGTWPCCGRSSHWPAGGSGLGRLGDGFDGGWDPALGVIAQALIVIWGALGGPLPTPLNDSLWDTSPRWDVPAARHPGAGRRQHQRRARD